MARTGPPAGVRGPDFQAVARRVASVDSLNTFLRDMRARYPETVLAPAVAPKAAATPPAKPNGQTLKTDPPAPPPKAPAGGPLKPALSPTGSILPRAATPRAR